MAIRIIDASTNVTAALDEFQAAGVVTVIRYDNRLAPTKPKQIKITEAKSIALANLRLGIVHQGFNNAPKYFSYELGFKDASYSRSRMPDRGQPSTSAIFFSVDFDASASDLQNCVVPYFQGIADAMAANSSFPSARVGVYGSGLTCATLKAKKLAQYFWLAASSGWREYSVFKRSGSWHMLQKPEITLARLGVDPNEANPQQPDFGDFTPVWIAQPRLQAADRKITATALNLRTLPWGEIKQVLPKGKKVRIIRVQSGWAEVDIDLDGVSDGYVSAKYLAPL